MFTPLSIDLRYERFPWATLSLLLLMILATGLTESASPEDLAPFLFTPANPQPWQSVTSQFLHAGVGHLLCNGLGVWVFGRYVEDRLGPLRFLLLFFACAHFADWTDLWSGSSLPSLGASGAIAGLLTVTLFQAPRADLQVSLEWRTGRGWHVPVWLFVGLWLLGELRSARNAGDGIAHAAHIGGAFAGCVAVWILRASWLTGSGWHFPREPAGGARSSQGFDELVKSEAVWKAIYEQKRRERERQGEM